MKKVYFIVSLLFIYLNIKAQNVGIGTSAPTAKLEVTSNTNNQIVIHGSNTGQGGYGVYGVTNNGGIGVLGESYLGNASLNSIGGWFITDGPANYALKAETLGTGTAAYFSSPSGNAVIVDQGNVGIAELVPTEKLHINNGNIKIGKTAWSSATDDKFLKFGDGNFVTIGEVGGDDKMEIKAKEITIKTSPSTPFFPAGNILIPNGKVGIGNNSPNASLAVNRGTGVDGTAAFFGTTHVSHFNYATNEDTYIRGGKDNSKVYLADNPGGAVGIGTSTTAGYKLAVNGNIRSKEVVVETGWADFVFAKDYKLPLLTEVEKYIIENKHLPEMPSAKEIQENGLKVGEVQTKMMQKIEELTLYVIELEKKIEEIKLANHTKK